MKAIIKLDVPEWQIGQDVAVYFPDTMMKNGKCELLKEQQEIVRCKDCKYGSIYMTEDVCGATLIECNNPNIGDAVAVHKWDWFCADGDRKET